MSPVRINLIRVFIGFIVFTLAEVFSHASQMGIFNPVTLLLIYPLYFSHFFVLTTLAIRFQKTSLANLYWWGCIFGLYESFITKVVWFGFGGEGFVAGSILGFGILETLSAVFV